MPRRTYPYGIPAPHRHTNLDKAQAGPRPAPADPTPPQAEAEAEDHPHDTGTLRAARDRRSTFAGDAVAVVVQVGPIGRIASRNVGATVRAGCAAIDVRRAC